MKILLSKNVAHLGIVGDVVNVKDGYARNFLFPRQLATIPTASNIQRLAAARKIAEAERATELAHMEALAQKLEGVEITITAKANADGVLYGSVSTRDIATALEAEGFVVDHKQITMSDTIRTLDKFNVEVRLSAEFRPSIKVWVVRERDASEQPAKEEATGEVSQEEASSTPS